ncbi:MAG: tRNA (adenosine(37)-N6)-dimethylallyltransferase MiaA [Pirellulales bacterium]
MSASKPELASDCIILTGPTASGKTAMGIRIARRLNADILSADSVAVYKGLNIGAAKPTLEEQAQVTHHLLDLVDPASLFTASDWLLAAAHVIQDCRARGRRILFVGGTPLYLRCLRDGLDEAPAMDVDFRTRLIHEIEQRGPKAFYEKLRRLRPDVAATIHPNDTKRLIRSLEIIQASGVDHSRSWDRASNSEKRLFPCPILVIDQPRKILNRRIHERVETMFESGIVEETEAAEQQRGIGTTAAQAAGYRESLAFIRGEITKQEAITKTKQRTRQLAKRQRTWFRSFSDAVWLSG